MLLWLVQLSSASNNVTVVVLSSVRFAFSVNVGEDCPVFDGMYEFCQLSTGGSVGKGCLLVKKLHA